MLVPVALEKRFAWLENVKIREEPLAVRGRTFNFKAQRRSINMLVLKLTE
ncbi:MAG: hypothetical protein QXR06_00220 [Candidatus Bathyarchaeia archaeon]|nr:hypothetical protein [Candidatus Bathyarchaeota archaeon]